MFLNDDIVTLLQDAHAELGRLLGLSVEVVKQGRADAEKHAATVLAAPQPPAAPTAQQNGANSEGTVVWLVWAEADLERLSPSLLMGYALLTSRRENAMFLRMATGFGFVQVRRPSPALCSGSDLTPVTSSNCCFIIS